VIIHAVKPKHTKREAMYLSFIGELFLRALKGCIVPLVVPSIIVAISAIPRSIGGKVGLRTFVYYLATTLLAITLGVILVLIIRPGEGKTTTPVEKAKARHVLLVDVILDLMRHLIPTNVLGAVLFTEKTELIKPELTKNGTLPPKTEWPFHMASSQRTNFLGLIMVSMVGKMCFSPPDERFNSFTFRFLVWPCPRPVPLAKLYSTFCLDLLRL
jgi:hypothetical protein